MQDFGTIEMLIRIGYAAYYDGCRGLWLTQKGREYVKSLAGAK